MGKGNGKPVQIIVYFGFKIPSVKITSVKEISKKVRKSL